MIEKHVVYQLLQCQMEFLQEKLDLKVPNEEVSFVNHVMGKVVLSRIEHLAILSWEKYRYISL